ncbi:MAG: type II secretion system inner membrane protein GspF [Deltaproteobacteria bacterium]|nr:type II secretion system inner membrane protein GspF [Deltaproteobacteria bacterium]
MPVFDYKGLDNSGKNVKGKIDGDNLKIARAKLRRQNIFPIELIEKATLEKPTQVGRFTKFFKRVKITDISIMTRQLATLIKANIPLVEALVAISDQLENERLKLIMTEVREQVNEGSSLATALGKHPEAFSNLYINMVKAGETAGTLDTVLLRLAEFTESSVKLRNKVTGAMMYPLLMTLVGAAIITGLFIFVIPQITQIFSEMEQALPLITRIVIGISDALRYYWYLVILGIFIFYTLFKKFSATEKGKRRIDATLLKLPIVGKMVRMISVSRFTSTLSTLLKGGVPLLAAMDIVKNVVDNTLIREALIKAKENITEGQSIAQPLRESGEFPAMVTHMISIGEKTGELESMLNTIADAYDNEVETTITALTQLLEPIMILLMGLGVGIIVMAVLLPILNLNNIASS